MVKTTVYLPEELKRALERTAASSGRSEAELIRAGIARILEEEAVPPPRAPLFASEPFAERVDELLAEGFGED